MLTYSHNMKIVWWVGHPLLGPLPALGALLLFFYHNKLSHITHTHTHTHTQRQCGVCGRGRYRGQWNRIKNPGINPHNYLQLTWQRCKSYSMEEQLFHKWCWSNSRAKSNSIPRGWGCSSVGECLPSIYKVLDKKILDLNLTPDIKVNWKSITCLI
jgi:hypothetical protein